jgi:diacylglycerol kinase family enzyme
MTPEKFDFFINRRSGTVLHVGEEKIRQELLEIFGAQTGDIRFLSGNELATTVRDWAENSSAEDRGLIIGGGDGSVLTAASEVVGREDIALGVLPLGTHNLFASQLGFAADFKKAAAQYKNNTTAHVDIGNVNGTYFLLGLMLDGNSVNFHETLERFRDKKRLPGLKKIFSAVAGVMTGHKTKLDISDRGPGVNVTEYSARVFAVTNNAVSPHPRQPGQKHRDPKTIIRDALAERPPEGQVCLYAFSGGPLKLPLIARAMRNGTWTKHKSITVQTAPQLFIGLSSPQDAQKNVRVTIDGEIKEISFPLEIKSIPKGLKVYKPAP